MRRAKMAVVLLALALALPDAAFAQEARHGQRMRQTDDSGESLVQSFRPGVAVHTGTTGFGADFAVGLSRRLAVRASGSVFPFDFDIRETDVDYRLSVPSPQFLLALDYYSVGTFRVTGGLMIRQADFDLEATPGGTIEIGGTEYPTAALGSLDGAVSTNATAPYVGVGFGSPNKRGLGFFMDLGAAFHGTPEVNVSANGPIAHHPQFRQDLAREVAQIQDELDSFKIYPVVRVGLMVGLGGQPSPASSASP